MCAIGLMLRILVARTTLEKSSTGAAEIFVEIERRRLIVHGLDSANEVAGIALPLKGVDIG